MLTEKRCPRCQQVLPSTSFAPRSKRPDGLNTYCRPCNTDYQREYWHTVKERRIPIRVERAKAQRKLNRLKMMEFLADKACVDCGVDDSRILEFDHLDAGAKTDCVSKMMGSHRWERILREIEKCEIVCPNCHRLRTYSRMETYRTLRVGAVR